MASVTNSSRGIPVVVVFLPAIFTKPVSLQGNVLLAYRQEEVKTLGKNVFHQRIGQRTSGMGTSVSGRIVELPSY